MQKRWHSIVEANANLITSYPVTYAMYVWVLPHFGYNFSKEQGLELTLIFSGVSLLRQYAIRRLFNWITVKGGNLGLRIVCGLRGQKNR